jgi:hypothetical protein
MDKKLRKRLYQRCAGYCEVCGRPLAEDSMAAHHRKLKGQGGEDVVHNLLALHHACHNMATHAVHLNVKQAHQYGWIVPSYFDPKKIPVLLHKKKAVRLTENGEYEPITYCFDCSSHMCCCEKGTTDE